MKYRKKPIEVEVLRWNGKNHKEISDFVGSWLQTNYEGSIQIPTLEGALYAPKGSFIIRGIKGEFYPCRPDIFEATYELLRGDNNS